MFSVCDPRRPSIPELVEECCNLTRWRMTDEVKVALETIKQSKKGGSKEKKKVGVNETLDR